MLIKHFPAHRSAVGEFLRHLGPIGKLRLGRAGLAHHGGSHHSKVRVSSR
jgi:hypothetical protein